MKKSNAFTLAEVLITLVIIGVIAAMTIPALMGSTNEQEIRSGLKKGFSAINQALALDYALYGNRTIINGNKAVNEGSLANMMKNHISIIKEERCPDDTGRLCLTTADGMIFEIYGDGDGIDLRVNSKNRVISWMCKDTVEEAENCKPNTFALNIMADSEPTDNRMYVSDIIGYAYLHDMSPREAYNILGATNCWEW